MSDPNTLFTSSNYSDTDLINIFPVTSFYSVKISGTAGSTTSSGTVTLYTRDASYNTTNYGVFSSIYYGYSGSDGTYNASNTASTMSQIVINTITASSFNYVFTHGSGDNLNIYVVFMVVFSSGLNYSKSY